MKILKQIIAPITNSNIAPQKNLSKKSLKYLMGSSCVIINNTLSKDKDGQTELDIEEIDSDINQDNYDNEYYTTYYNIDLNLAKNKAFRDGELFNPLRDDEQQPEYERYDEDDIPIASNIRNTHGLEYNIDEYQIIDTDLEYSKPNIAITKPWIISEMMDEIREAMRPRKPKYFDAYEELNTSDSNIKKMIQAATVNINGKERLEPKFKILSLLLFRNSGEWGETEENIMKLTTQSADTYSSINNLIHIKRYLKNGLKNEEIYNIVKKKEL